MNLWKKIKNIFQKNKNFLPPITQKDGKKTKIFVGVSGGVDSSVSLLLLKNMGYEVEGVFFKKFTLDKKKCQSEKKDAESVCADLEIPFHFLDLEEEYKEKILKYFIETYADGKTPNPDVFCNREIKFGAFQEWAFDKGADFIATGHYAQNIFNKKKEIHFLKMAKDKNKDQSYFLSMLSQSQLSRSVFPLGNLTKPEVRKIAEKNNLITAEKKDSQGICFLGEKINLKDFLKGYISEKKGVVLDLKGEKIGEHSGVVFYTIGERHGFEIFPEKKTPSMPRLFVVRKDLNKNILVVGSSDELKKINQNNEKKEIRFSKSNWISEEPDFTKRYYGRVRYRGELIGSKISYSGPQHVCRAEVCVEDEILDEKLKAVFDKPHSFIASGQILVFYDNDICLGGGVIE